MAQLNTNPAELLGIAEAYTDLYARAAALGPRAIDETQRIITSHGAMGYPLALGLVAGLNQRQAALDTQATQFTHHSQRFTEHAVTYAGHDHDAANDYHAPADMIDFTTHRIGPLPQGRVICTGMLGGFRCSEFLPGGMIYHFLSPVDFTGQWPDE